MCYNFRLAEHEEKVTAYLKDDFNTPGVMNCILDLISTLNSNLAKVGVHNKA